jgi:hypothetical protein
VNHQERKHIQQYVARSLKKRKATLASNENSRERYKKTAFFWSVIAVMSAFVMGAAATEEYKAGNTINAIRTLFPTVCYYLGARAFILKSSKGPTDENEKDIWLWDNGRKWWMLCLTAFTFAIVALSWPVGDYLPHTPITYFLLWFAWLSIFMAGASVFLIIWRPQLFLSSTLGSIASSSWIGGVSAGLFTFLRGWQGLKLSSSEYEMFGDFFLVIVGLYGTLFMLLSIFRNFKSFKKGNILNPLQYSVIRFVRPEKILTALRDASQKVCDQINALEIIKDLDERRDYGTKVALLEYLAKEQKSFSKKMTILFSLMAFIISSVGAVFFQDLIYHTFAKSYLCEYFNILCN